MLSVDILAGLTLICYIAIVALLARQYLRTRDLGLIWLAIAVVVWPFLSRMLQTGEKVFIDRLVRHQPVDLFPFTLVEKGQITIGSLVLLLTYTQQLIGVVLLLVAVLYLSKMKIGRSPEPSRSVSI
jgi:ABC-type polysaccharide/polyol phosphate export permease